MVTIKKMVVKVIVEALVRKGLIKLESDWIILFSGTKNYFLLKINLIYKNIK